MAYPTSIQQPAPFNSQAQPVEYRSSPSPDADVNSNNGSGQRHHRAYQACEACRERKVKCDMGPVDQPHEPPCAKCKREHKQCVFSSSRKKSPTRRSNTGSNGSNGLKRARTGSSVDESAQRPRPAPAFQTPNFKNAFTSSSSSPNFTSSPIGVVARPVDLTANRPARSVPQSLPNSQTNGLPPIARSVANLKQNPNHQDEPQQFRSSWAANLMSEPVASSQDGMQLLFKAAAETSGESPSAMHSPESQSRRSRTFSTNVCGPNEVNIPIRSPEHAAEVEKALELWSRLRFVRAGWISAAEAMNYIEYFYANLAPMTPVVTPDYRSLSKHAILLTEEPVLTLTILAITSRQVTLGGPGATSRSYNIHDKLWDALRRMVERLLWGQEQFGGGLSGGGAGAVPIRESKTGQISWKGSLRTLGTIEALLLLIDWQPRALHFPPSGDDENWLVEGDRAQLISESAVNEEDSSGGVILASSLEPGWRSDRMSWMLLALAQSLAFELGVFDNDHDPHDMSSGQVADMIRKRRLRRLVLLFVAQTSGRIGIKSMLSPVADRDTGPYANYKEDSTDAMQTLWLEIASIMYNANLDIFLTRQQTRNLLDTNKYKDEIEKLAPRLERWKNQFDRVSDQFNATMKNVMLMEYEYARLFINSPSFNKVVESWKNQGPNVDNANLTQVAEENKKYINEVKEAAASLLTAALEGFAEPKQLRNAPIRTYLRSFAGMVFTLKLFSLGNHEATLRRYFNLLEHITEAMEKQVVDDVHISNQIAAAVRTLLANVRTSLIRVQKTGVTSNPSSREHSRQHSPHRTAQRGNVKTGMQQETRYVPAPTQLSPDPFADIPSRPIAEFSTNTFIPPPEYNQGLEMNGGIHYDPGLDQSMNDADWFALPLDHLFNSTNGQLETSLGGLGDTDFLDVLTGAHNNNNLNAWNNNIYMPGSGLGGMTGFQ